MWLSGVERTDEEEGEESWRKERIRSSRSIIILRGKDRSNQRVMIKDYISDRGCFTI